MNKPKASDSSKAPPPAMDKAVRNMFALKPADVRRILKGPGKKRGA